MQTDHIFIRIAIHLACSRISLDNKATKVEDFQAIGTGFKDSSVLLLLLAQSLLSLYLLGDITHHPQNMRLPLVGESSAVHFNVELRTVFPHIHSTTLKLSSRFNCLKRIFEDIMRIWLYEGSRVRADKFPIGIAKLLTSRRVYLDNMTAFEIAHEQSIATGLKDSPILDFLLA